MKLLNAALLLAAGLAVSLGQALADEAAKPDPREKVETSIAEAIRLLEAKEFETLINNFLPPDELSSLTSQVSMAQIIAIYEQRAPQHLKALKEAQKAMPTYDGDGLVATFKLAKPINGQDAVVFKKIDKFWYPANARN